MYKLKFLPITKKDMDNIIYYVFNNLKNPLAAKELAKCFIKSIDTILKFPYKAPIYIPLEKLKNDYRKIKIKNFLMFYMID